MTGEPRVLVERRGSQGWITLNRPESRNPLDAGTAADVLAAFEEHFADPQVRSVVVTGAGDAFCAGGDLEQMRRMPTLRAQEAYEWPNAIVEMTRLMLRAPKPVIAAVNGPALAGGMGLAGMCDIIVADRSARFGTPEVKIGLFPMIIVAHLSRSLPRKRLLEMMLTGEPIDAEEGYRLGFVNRLVDGLAEMEETLRHYATLFERVAPNAVRLGRRTFSVMADITAEQALDAAQVFNTMFLGSDEFAEGTAAFFEKRRPSWSS